MISTVNICLGHLPFPETYADRVDVFLTSRQIDGHSHAVFVDDAIWGPNGGALSEYSQLLWLSDNFDQVVGESAFVRVFQYRRFVSRNRVGRQATADFFTYIHADELESFADDFARNDEVELFNRPHQFRGGMLSQYAEVHPMDDLMAVLRFLLHTGRITPMAAAAFLREDYVIPSCNMGVFRRQTLKHILNLLRPVAGFLQSPDYVARDGYNRRSLGFILERLHSFIILDLIRTGQAAQNFGNHIVISESAEVPRTINI